VVQSWRNYLGKKKDTEENLTEEKVEENFKNLASILKHIPDRKNK
jgi:hypothetical protein